MAKKITPRETCMICDEDPCVCQTASKSKRLRNHGEEATPDEEP